MGAGRGGAFQGFSEPWGGQLGEWSRQLVPRDLLAVDLDPLEEGLVQQTSLDVVRLQVGGLDALREIERVVERLQDRLLLDLIATEQFVCRHPLAADALLLLGEDVVADRVVVVGGKELSLLVVEPNDLGPGAGGLLLGNQGEPLHVLVDGGANALALLVG
ncbi:MAG: hypothetical protein ABSB96_04260 [Gaiellaceae bacterium]